MALETLAASQRTAAELLGMPYEAPVYHVHDLGMIAVGGHEFPALRAHCGPEELCGGSDDKIGKGGTRMALYSSINEARHIAGELSVEMEE